MIVNFISNVLRKNQRLSDADDFDNETCKNIDNPWTYVDKCSSNLAVAHKSTSICFEKIHKDLEKCSEMSSYFEKSASMQPRNNPPNFQFCH